MSRFELTFFEKDKRVSVKDGKKLGWNLKKNTKNVYRLKAEKQVESTYEILQDKRLRSLRLGEDTSRDKN